MIPYQGKPIGISQSVANLKAVGVPGHHKNAYSVGIPAG